MRFSILSIAIALIALVGNAHAEDTSQQGTMSVSEDRIIDVFESSTDSEPTINPLDLEALMERVRSEICQEEGRVMTFGHRIDCDALCPELDQQVARTNQELMAQLLITVARAAWAEARIEVLRLELIEAGMIAELQEMHELNGIMYTADEYADLAAEAQGYWDELVAANEELNLLQDEAAESCRRNAEAGTPLVVCEEPAHLRALERP